MDKVFTIEFDPKNETLEMHLNKLGAEFLIDELKALIFNNQQEHAHLMTPEWGGNELSSDKQNLSSEVELVNHLKIFFWPGKNLASQG